MLLEYYLCNNSRITTNVYVIATKDQDHPLEIAKAPINETWHKSTYSI